MPTPPLPATSGSAGGPALAELVAKAVAVAGGAPHQDLPCLPALELLVSSCEATLPSTWRRVPSAPPWS